MKSEETLCCELWATKLWAIRLWNLKAPSSKLTAPCFFFANYSNEFTCAIRGKLVPYYLRAKSALPPRSVSSPSNQIPSHWSTQISTNQVNDKQKSVWIHGGPCSMFSLRTRGSLRWMVLNAWALTTFVRKACYRRVRRETKFLATDFHGLSQWQAKLSESMVVRARCFLCVLGVLRGEWF